MEVFIALVVLALLLPVFLIVGVLFLVSIIFGKKGGNSVTGVISEHTNTVRNTKREKL